VTGTFQWIGVSNFSKNETVLRAVPHDVQGVKDKKKQQQQLPSQSFLKEKKDTKSTKTFSGIFDFRLGFWNLTSAKSEG
jgi:hypothetical protein